MSHASGQAIFGSRITVTGASKGKHQTRQVLAHKSWAVAGQHYSSYYYVLRVSELSGKGSAATKVLMIEEDGKFGSGSADPALIDFIRRAGLRPTRQRLALGGLLFAKGDRHVSAEMLHAEAESAGECVSLATVYNTLHQFRRAGLLREIAIEGSKTYFDTNVSNHNHFLVESDGRIMDIPGDSIRVDGVPEPPKGMRISHIDVVVRLVPDTSSE